jgi:hypothetical protein
VVAAPVFRAIAGTVLKRLGVEGPVPPVETVSVEHPRAPAKRMAATRTRAAAPDAPATPSFLGLSRREALARARGDGWNVEVTGVGYVREQAPAPGTPLAPDRRLALRLVPDAASLQASP